MLADDDLPPARARLISDALLKHKSADLCLYSYARPEKGFNDVELLERMHAGGFRLLLWGVESGVQRVLDEMNKGTQVACVGEILAKSSQRGIINLCFALFGFPGETESEAQATVDFMRRNAEHIDLVNLSAFTLLSCCEVAKTPDGWGVKVAGDGSFTVNRGISPLRAQQFLLDTKAYNPEIVCDVSRALFHQPQRFSYYQLSTAVLVQEAGLLMGGDVLCGIEERELQAIFPVIPGGVSLAGTVRLWYPLDYRKGAYEKRPVVLSDAAGRAQELSDGSLSVKQIIDKVRVQYRDDEQAADACRSFFKQVLKRGWGVFFNRPLRKIERVK
jgi:hypothetical protein